MTTQKTPHTESQQNRQPEQADLDLDQQALESGHQHDAALYEKYGGAQTGGTRAFHANQEGGSQLKTAPFTAAVDGGTATRTPESDKQGVTNRSASEESVGQRKVVSERPDAQAGVNQVGHRLDAND